MASKSKSKISPWNAPKDKNNTKANSSSTTSFQRTAMQKLKQHPAYVDYGENQLSMEAKELTDPEMIMNTYFSQIVHQPVAVRVDEKLEESDTEFVTSMEGKASNDRSRWRVEDTAKLQVKLLLRRIETNMPALAHTAASILQMQYGPLHTSLLINNDILLEWNTGSLVIPEHYDGDSQRYPIITSALNRTNNVSLIKYDPKDEIDLLFQATKSKVDILNALIKVIVKYNGKFYYHAVHRNCQTFVVEALEAMGCENPPKFEGRLAKYFKNLKGGTAKAEFRSHEELDRYVKENVTSIKDKENQLLNTQEKEYLLGQYFEFHIRAMTESEDPDGWHCEEQHCLMKDLESHIEKEAMEMYRFLHISEDSDQ